MKISLKIKRLYRFGIGSFEYGIDKSYSTGMLN